MSDSVKFIFKTLIKVPILIFVAYFIFNIFAFAFIYFRMLGISYVVMQTSVENNYIPRNEANTLVDYLRDTAKISMVEDVGIVIGDNTSPHAGSAIPDSRLGTTGLIYVPIDGDTDIGDEATIMDSLYNAGVGGFKKQQYGSNVICGVYCEYKIIWPLDYRYTGDRDAIMNSADGSYTYDDVAGYDANQTTGRDSYLSGFARIPITITYKVPGLKYYPDMNIY